VNVLIISASRVAPKLRKVPTQPKNKTNQPPLRSDWLCIEANVNDQKIGEQGMYKPQSGSLERIECFLWEHGWE